MFIQLLLHQDVIPKRILNLYSEIKKLLEDDIIEESRSPRHAQTLVTSNEHHKKQMVINCSQNINFTLFDFFPLSRVDDIVKQVAKFNFFSTIDLKSAYHQIPIVDSDKHFTAFEHLYQFKRIPLSITNGVSSFQRVMNHIIQQENLKNTFIYFDDITICGSNHDEHDLNLKKLFIVAEKYNLTINNSNSKYSTSSINLLHYQISHNSLKPDFDRLKSLLELPEPHNIALMRNGMFLHCSPWIHNFSYKIHPLAETITFPLNTEALHYLYFLKTKYLFQKTTSNLDRTTLHVNAS